MIGGGIAGIQASLDIANCGYQVILIEKDPSIGGHMSQLSETFPTLDCSQCILTPRMVEVAQHPNITLYTYAELESLEGFIGNFKASIRLKAKSIDEKLCTGCGLCTTKCPTKKIPSEFNAGLGMRTAIYVPFPQAVPNKPVIDRVHCTHFRTGRCGVCEKVCPTGAIRFDQEDRIISENIGAIVVTTGFNVLNTDFSRNMAMENIKILLPGFSLNGWLLHPDLLWEKSVVLQMVKSLKKLCLLHVPVHAIRQKVFLTVPKYAVCILPNMLCFISIKYTMVNLMSFIWIFVQVVRIMKNLCVERLKKMG